MRSVLVGALGQSSEVGGDAPAVLAARSAGSAQPPAESAAAGLASIGPFEGEEEKRDADEGGDH